MTLNIWKDTHFTKILLSYQTRKTPNDNSTREDIRKQARLLVKVQGGTTIRKGKMSWDTMTHLWIPDTQEAEIKIVWIVVLSQPRQKVSKTSSRPMVRHMVLAMQGSTNRKFTVQSVRHKTIPYFENNQRENGWLVAQVVKSLLSK
jgi:hypothetical protein